MTARTAYLRKTESLETAQNDVYRTVTGY